MKTTSQKCIALAKVLGREYSLKGRDLTLDEVFSDKGLLPGLAKRADQLCSLCLGYGIGVSFEDEQESTLGYKAVFEEGDDEVIRLLCILDSLKDIIDVSDVGRVSLDELLYD